MPEHYGSHQAIEQWDKGERKVRGKMEMSWECVVLAHGLLIALELDVDIKNVEILGKLVRCALVRPENAMP